MIYGALWDLAETSVPLTSLVAIGNRVRFDSTKNVDPIKREITQSDLPELMLVATGGSGNLMETSSSSRFNRTYDWLLATGDLSMTQKLLPVEFALWCALHEWKSVVTALTWNGQPFVKRVSLNSVNNGFTDPERNRGIRGWSAIWSCEVETHFRSEDLRSYNDGGFPTTT